MIFQFSKCSKLVLMEHRDLHKLADRLGDPGEWTGIGSLLFFIPMHRYSMYCSRVKKVRCGGHTILEFIYTL